jgi:uncharacterized protein YabN with tetrapyrrole methylase and pyrophosphatase domain
VDRAAMTDDLRAAAAAAVRLADGRASAAGASLTVVGTGIRAIGQLTIEALAAIAEAEALLHVIGDPVQEGALRAINPAAQTMIGYYSDGGQRYSAYEAMVRHILAEVASGKRTVAAFYGHPGVFTYPSHESVRRARAAGYPARMLPAVSAEDCLFADLGIDPGDGCQSFEATDFVFSQRTFDPSSHLVLFQVGHFGRLTYEPTATGLEAFPALVHKLAAAYPPGHTATIYEAPFDPAGVARVQRVPIAALRDVQMTPATTLYVPPIAWGW